MLIILYSVEFCNSQDCARHQIYQSRNFPFEDTSPVTWYKLHMILMSALKWLIKDKKAKGMPPETSGEVSQGRWELNWTFSDL